MSDQLIEELYKGPDDRDPKHLRKLLEGVDPNLRTNNEDCTGFLHIAALGGYLEAIQMLIEMGADIEIQNVFGDTPVHCAVHFNHYNIVRYLLLKGANKEARNLGGDTPLLTIDCFYNDYSEDTMKTLLILLQYGCDINAKNMYGTTVLHICCGLPNVVKVLSEHGSDPCIRTNSGKNYKEFKK